MAEPGEQEGERGEALPRRGVGEQRGEGAVAPFLDRQVGEGDQCQADQGPIQFIQRAEQAEGLDAALG